MKCVFCKKDAGFFKSYHEECKNHVEDVTSQINEIVNKYNQNLISAVDAKKSIRSKVVSDSLYRNAVGRVYNSAIRSDEVTIYLESNISILESKNRCKMMETGYRYEKMPVWNESNIKIAQYGDVIFTDKAIYLSCDASRNTMRYPLSHIVNIGEPQSNIFNSSMYFDIKTSSPYPHRFTCVVENKKNKPQIVNVYLMLKCLTGFKEA